MRHQFPVLDEQQPEIVVATLNQPVTWTEKPVDRRKSFDMPKNLSAYPQRSKCCVSARAVQPKSKSKP
jgi:hypothetical protein